PALARIDHAGGDMGDGGFSRTRRPDQRHDLARAHAQRDGVQHLAAEEGMADALQFQHGHRLTPQGAAASRQRSSSDRSGRISTYSTTISAATASPTQAIASAMSSIARARASAPPMPPALASSSAMIATLKDDPSARISAGNSWVEICRAATWVKRRIGPAPKTRAISSIP